MCGEDFSGLPLPAPSHLRSLLKLLKLSSKPVAPGSCFLLRVILVHPRAENAHPGLAVCPAQDTGPSCPHRVQSELGISAPFLSRVTPSRQEDREDPSLPPTQGSPPCSGAVSRCDCITAAGCFLLWLKTRV